MDYIRAFDVEVDRPVYYAGEMLTGHVYVEVEENMRMQNIKVFLRGKAHAEWKITRAGERRTMKQDEHYIDERILLWGKGGKILFTFTEDDDTQGIPILTRGRHRYPFHFQLPETALPCSFESKIGNIRYYVRVNLNIPYASCPQCIRYFTIIGPHIDCMDERFLTPVASVAKRNTCSLCCGKGPLLLRATLERTSYVCGEQIKLKAEVQNGSDSEVWVLCKLIQYVEFFINKGVLGLTKEVRHTVLEAESDKVAAHDTSRLDELMGRLVVPLMPPTMLEVCGLVQIYYTLKLYLETSKGKGDAAEISMPITIATVPFRIANGPMPDIHYEIAAQNVEGGMYISPEFQLGQVYMGDEVDPETDQTILYRPVYVCVSDDRPPSRTDAHLLQVPGRQLGRSRENVRGSREGLHLQENITAAHSAQQQMKLFQIPGDDGGSGSSKGKPEDKFLKEITAKIANRQMRGEEDARVGVGIADDPTHPHDVDAQVELLRKQKKSNDNVHKALVNELRRHLSEGEDNIEVEKVPPGLKKPTAWKKAPITTGTTDPSKRMKTDVGKDSKVLTESAYAGREDDWFSEKTEQRSSIGAEGVDTAAESFNMIQSMEKAERIGPGSEVDNEENIEYTEHSALLTSTDNIQMDIDEKHSARPEASRQDRYSDYEISMQQSIGELPSGALEYSDRPSAQFSSREEVLVAGQREIIHGFGSSEAAESSTVRYRSSSPRPFKPSSPRSIRSSSPGKRIDNITPAALAATVIAAAPAAADPPPSPKTIPLVAPKPKHKDRHSFPAAHPSFESSGLSVEVVNRPKSEMMEQTRQDQYRDDSIA